MTLRDKINYAVIVVLALTVFLIPFLLIALVPRAQALKKNRRPWLWYWLGVTLPLPVFIASFVAEEARA